MIDCDLRPGDRVVLIESRPDRNDSLVAGDEGTVCKPWRSNSSAWVNVEWDKPVQNGHDCDGACPDGYGWKVNVSLLELIPNREYDIEDAAIPDVYELLSFMCE